jgi:excisionase family DNA binding protein
MHNNFQLPAEQAPAVLTVEEWAAKMRISRSAAYDAVKNGDVVVIRIGRLIRIPNRAVA